MLMPFTICGNLLFNSRYSCNLIFFSVNDNFILLYFRYFIVVYRSPASTKNRLTFPLFQEEFTSFLERVVFSSDWLLFLSFTNITTTSLLFPSSSKTKTATSRFLFPYSTTTTTFPSIPAPLLPAPQCYRFYPTPPPSLHLCCRPPTPSPPTVLFFFYHHYLEKIWIYGRDFGSTEMWLISS